jgi:hypothetical protein
MLNKFDNKRQGMVRVFHAREGMHKVGWNYIRFRVLDDVCQSSMTVQQISPQQAISKVAPLQR